MKVFLVDVNTAAKPDDVQIRTYNVLANHIGQALSATFSEYAFQDLRRIFAIRAGTTVDWDATRGER